MKDVLILGGGFAGVAAGLKLTRSLREDEAVVTLIDNSDFHVFTPSLYEIATSEEPKKNIAVHYRKIFGRKLEVLIGNIAQIKPSSQEVVLDHGKNLHFDYLVICLGSEAAYFNISGIKEYSVPLKKLSDAIVIKESLENLIKSKISKNQKVRIVIGGGGFSGVELAAELTNFNDRLTAKYPKLSTPLQLTIIEGFERLLGGLDLKISEIAKKKLETDGVNLVFNNFIKSVTKDAIQLSSGQKYLYDLLIWTGGVRANSILKKSGFETNRLGQISIDRSLKVKGYENIFAAGDCAEVIDFRTKKPVPLLGQAARDQGKIAGENVYRKMHEQDLKEYKSKNYGVLIPLKGRYVIADLKFVKFAGFFGWVLQQLAYLRYLLAILPFYLALKRWNKFERELKQI